MRSRRGSFSPWTSRPTRSLMCSTGSSKRTAAASSPTTARGSSIDARARARSNRGRGPPHASISLFFRISERASHFLLQTDGWRRARRLVLRQKQADILFQNMIICSFLSIIFKILIILFVISRDTDRLSSGQSTELWEKRVLRCLCCAAQLAGWVGAVASPRLLPQ